MHLWPTPDTSRILGDAEGILPLVENSMNTPVDAAFRHPGRVRAGVAALTLILLAACPPKTDLSGTYESSDKEGVMTIEFKGGGKVHMTMQETGGQPQSSDGDVLIDGNKVTIQIPGGMPLSLTRNDNTLEGSFMGQVLRFTKK